MADVVEPKTTAQEQHVEKGAVPASHDADTALNANVEARYSLLDI